MALREEGITVRNMRKRDLEAEIHRFMEVYNEAWGDNWGFVPVTEAEVAFQAKNLKQVIDENWTWIAEKDGEVVGAALTLPDINQVLAKMNGRLLPFGWLALPHRPRKIDQCRVFALGVKHDYRHTGVAASLYLKHIEDGGTPRRDHRRRDGLDPRDQRADEPGDGGDGGQGREAYRLFEKRALSGSRIARYLRGLRNHWCDAASAIARVGQVSGLKTDLEAEVVSEEDAEPGAADRVRALPLPYEQPKPPALRNEVRSAAIAAAGGVLAGAATVAAVRAVGAAGRRGRSSRRLARREPGAGQRRRQPLLPGRRSPARTVSTARGSGLEVEVRPPSPFRLPSGGGDRVMRRSGGVATRLLHVAGTPVAVHAWQTGSGTVRFRAEPLEPAAVAAPDLRGSPRGRSPGRSRPARGRDRADALRPRRRRRPLRLLPQLSPRSAARPAAAAPPAPAPAATALALGGAGLGGHQPADRGGPRRSHPAPHRPSLGTSPGRGPGGPARRPLRRRDRRPRPGRARVHRPRGAARDRPAGGRPRRRRRALRPRPTPPRMPVCWRGGTSAPGPCSASASRPRRPRLPARRGPRLPEAGRAIGAALAGGRRSRRSRSSTRRTSPTAAWRACTPSSASTTWSRGAARSASPPRAALPGLWRSALHRAPRR